jgi:RNA polymerase II subunit A-like phosphatase
MLIHSPPTLHYPITITSIVIQHKHEVTRSAILFSYSYTTKKPIFDSVGEQTFVTRSSYADFRSEVDGTLLTWKVAKGDVISRDGIPLVEIDEPCRHEIQFAGMCTTCGKDMTTVDFITTVTDDQRATINMVHGNSQLKVSQNEAHRANEASTKRLLLDKKLSLVVDLDQTIIHAVCDPTVGDWQKDESNPNHDAVKDVQSFELPEDIAANRSCSYYIKMRPGLQEFLHRMAQIYELHIYTMGTRSYAESVAKIVDPDRKYFGDRILSRDESGSMTSKNLHRIFPVDTKMVVIIDDRGDVWRYSDNLVRVRAFNFFVGIGDINSGFLPKRPDTDNLLNNGTLPPDSTTKEPEKPEVIEEIIANLENSNDPATLKEQSQQRQETIADQVESRPLLREQEKLDHEQKDGDAEKEVIEQHRHPLLHDDDNELHFLDQILTNVHSNFFTTYDKHVAKANAGLGRIAQLRGDSKKSAIDDDSLIPDISELMPAMKEEVLEDVVICFTGVIPQGMEHDRQVLNPTDSFLQLPNIFASSDIGIWARSFGARVSPNLTTSTTHVVADKNRRTVKVREAAKHNHIKIVDRYWLLECFSSWTRIDETPYLIQVNEQDILPNTLADSDHELDPDFASVVEGFSPENFALIDEELDDMIGGSDSDDDSNVSENDDSEMEEEAIINARKHKIEEDALLNDRKRKSNQISDDDFTTEDLLNPSTTANGNGIERPSSRLELRKKRAMERTTSLSKVLHIDEAAEVQPKSLVLPVSLPPDFDEDEDALDREMMAGFGA